MRATPVRVGAIDYIAMVGIVSGIGKALHAWSARSSLWEDEIIAITHGLQPLPFFFVEILRNDIHPFLYFFVLKGWSAINFASDSWALSSSLAAALLSAAVVFAVGAREAGLRAGLLATAAFCVLPTFAWAASNLRMYGLVPGIAVAAWYANREYLRSGKARWAGGFLALQLMLGFCHAIGFFFAAFVAAAALVSEWRNSDRRSLRSWFLLQVLCGIVFLPLMVSAIVRGTEPLGAPSLYSVISYPAAVTSVWGSGQTVLGGLTFVFLLALGFAHRPSRPTLLVLPVGCLLVAICAGMLGKPMFKPPVFTAHLVPFLALGAGAGVAASSIRSVKIVASCCLAAMAVTIWAKPQYRQSEENYAPAAQFIRSRVADGDVVVIPNVSVYWGILRYAVDPRWGRPLDVMPLKSNEAWAGLIHRLGSDWASRLGLRPSRDYVERNGVKFVIGTDAIRHTEAEQRVWIVHRSNYQERVRLGSPVVVTDVTWFGRELSVTRAASNQAGAFVVGNPPR